MFKGFWKRLKGWPWTQRFFHRESLLLTPWHIIGWWEARRVAYNLIVGIAGALSIILCLLSGLVSEMKFGTEFGLPDPPLFAVFGVILYAIAANVMYTGGWLAELVLNRLWKEPWPEFGPATLALGLALSVLLTLIPGVVSTGLTLVQFFTGPLSWGMPD